MEILQSFNCLGREIRQILARNKKSHKTGRGEPKGEREKKVLVPRCSSSPLQYHGWFHSILIVGLKHSLRRWRMKPFKPLNTVLDLASVLEMNAASPFLLPSQFSLPSAKILKNLVPRDHIPFWHSGRKRVEIHFLGAINFWPMKQFQNVETESTVQNLRDPLQSLESAKMCQTQERAPLPLSAPLGKTCHFQFPSRGSNPSFLRLALDRKFTIFLHSISQNDPSLWKIMLNDSFHEGQSNSYSKVCWHPIAIVLVPYKDFSA